MPRLPEVSENRARTVTVSPGLGVALYCAGITAVARGLSPSEGETQDAASKSRLIAALKSLKGDNHEVRVNSLPDVEHFWMLREQHTTFANGAHPAGDDSSTDSSTAAETPELPA